jgi:ribosome-associated heat shock protein Hsp15
VSEGAEPVRLDKWLWAARFFKTRSLAAEAIDAGHVQVNETRVKRSRVVKVGESVSIRKGLYEFVVIVEAVSDYRGPASEAQKLYRETDASQARRAERAEQHRLASLNAPAPERRPDKRDRRRIIRFVDKGR